MTATAGASPVRVLHILGIDDTGRVQIKFLRDNPGRHRYVYVGNVELTAFLYDEGFEVVELLRGPMPSEPVRVPPVDVIVNAICDPDTNRQALHKTQNVVDQTRLPVVNHPAAVLRSGRAEVAAALAGEPGMLVPRTAEIWPNYRSDIETLLADGEWNYPLLVREAGSHGGKQLALLAGPEDLRELDHFALDGRKHYLSEFVDFRSDDGLYRKCRVIVVDGEPFPKHVIVSDHWNVHAADRERVMSGRPTLFAEEEHFVSSFPGQAERELFGRIRDRLGLDYFGMDFGVDNEGRMTVFEVNACFRALLGTQSESRFEWQAEVVEAMKGRFRNLVRTRAGR